MNQHKPIHTRTDVSQGAESEFALRDVIAFFRIYRAAILAFMVAGAVLALAYAMTTTPLFTSESRLLVDANRGQINRSREDAASAVLDVSEIETQLQIIRSQKIALMVVDALDLSRDPEFANPEIGLIRMIVSYVRGWFGADGPGWQEPGQNASDPRFVAARELIEVLRVSRVGASYVVSVSVTSESAAKAANIVNTLTTSYISERLDAKYEVAQRVTNLDEERAREIRTRVISVATAAESPSHPRKVLLVVLGLLAGGALGVFVALVQRSLDKAVRTPGQLARLGLVHLGALPSVGFRQSFTDRLMSLIPGTKRSPVPGLQYVREKPLSLYSQSLRRVKGAVQISKRGRAGICIGMISAVMGEGKSTVSSNLAWLLDGGHGQTVLIDCDLHSKSLSRAYNLDTAKSRSMPFIDAARLRATLVSPSAWPKDDKAEQGGEGDGQPPVQAMPSEDLVASPRMGSFLSALRKKFEYIVIDLPPAILVPDALILARDLDKIIIVVDWGRTSMDLIASVYSALGENQHKVLGVILNRADMTRLHNEGHESLGYTYPVHH